MQEEHSRHPKSNLLDEKSSFLVTSVHPLDAFLIPTPLKRSSTGLPSKHRKMFEDSLVYVEQFEFGLRTTPSEHDLSRNLSVKEPPSNGMTAAKPHLTISRQPSPQPQLSRLLTTNPNTPLFSLSILVILLLALFYPNEMIKDTNDQPAMAPFL